jgi:hypothetical protein
MKIKTIITFFFLTSFISYSQTNYKPLYKKFDEIVGLSNTNLSYGILYTEKYNSLKDNHHYFKTKKFKVGNVRYQKEDFFDIYLKYDLNDDNLIVNISNELKTFSIVLEKNLIDFFSIDNHQFINIKNYGFNEMLFSSKNISIYKKHATIKKKRLNKYLSYEFTDNNSYLLYYNKSYFKVNKKKDFIKIFSNKKKFITSYFKTNKPMQKKNFDVFITQFIQQLSHKIKD